MTFSGSVVVCMYQATRNIQNMKETFYQKNSTQEEIAESFQGILKEEKYQYCEAGDWCIRTKEEVIQRISELFANTDWYVVQVVGELEAYSFHPCGEFKEYFGRSSKPEWGSTLITGDYVAGYQDRGMLKLPIYRLLNDEFKSIPYGGNDWLYICDVNTPYKLGTVLNGSIESVLKKEIEDNNTFNTCVQREGYRTQKLAQARMELERLERTVRKFHVVSMPVLHYGVDVELQHVFDTLEEAVMYCRAITPDKWESRGNGCIEIKSNNKTVFIINNPNR